MWLSRAAGLRRYRSLTNADARDQTEAGSSPGPERLCFTTKLVDSQGPGYPARPTSVWLSAFRPWKKSEPPNFNACAPREAEIAWRTFKLRGVWNWGTEVVRPIRCRFPPGKLKTGIPPQIAGSDGAFFNPISSCGQPEPKLGGSWKKSPMA